MYMVYLDGERFPVAPGKIVTENENNNKEVELIDGSFVLRGGGKGLKRISFELLLPMNEYPFAVYEAGFRDGMYYVDVLERISKEKKPVWLDIYRTTGDMNKTYLTNILVMTDKITVIEDADNGLDLKVRVELIEYRNTETKVATEKRNTKAQTRESDLEVPYTYVVKQGDSLWRIAKLYFDDGNMYTYLAQINSIKKPYTIYAGQVIKLRG